jgi:phosphate transport system permease protein
MRFDRDARRRIKNLVMMGLTVACVAFALVPLGSILYSVAVQGASVINVQFFTETQPVPCSPNPLTSCTQGGIMQAFVGTLLLLAYSCLISIPLGILVGIYLAEYGKGPLAFAVRFLADVMTGLPSIIFGMFIFSSFLIIRPGRVFSLLAGTLALAVLVLPFVARTTEEALRLVPTSLREAALALGVPRYRVTGRVVLSSAREGVITGAILAMARIGGETAPLIMTAFGNTFGSTSLDQPVGAMSLIIFYNAASPYANWNALAWGAALVLVLMMLGLSIAVRVLLRRRFRERRIAA